MALFEENVLSSQVCHTLFQSYAPFSAFLTLHFRALAQNDVDTIEHSIGIVAHIVFAAERFLNETIP